MMACNTLGVHKGSAEWMFKNFLQEPAKDTLILRVTSPEKDFKAKDGKLTTYSDVVN